VYLVSSAADDGTAGTLRDAINQANAPGSKITEIDFAIGTPGSAQTINLTSQLPALTASGVYVKGQSQGGSGNTNQLTTLNGSGAGSGIDGLLLQGSNCTVSGLILENFTNGIEVGGANNIIGGSVAGARNVISGNSGVGVLLDSGASGNQVLGNYVGTNIGGTAALSNSIGVEVAGNNNIVGASGARNLISGNSNDGVKIDSGASGNLVLGNYIGVNTYDTAALGNSGNGIEVAGNSNTIGASYVVAPNEISGNSNDGVLLTSGGSGNLVLGNYIGANHAGTAAVPNKVGIEDAGSGNTIGGSVLGARNVISGNSGDGMLVDGSATGETVQGNYIGLDYSGKTALANGSNGVEMQGSNNTNGGNSGSNYYVRNFLSGNSGDGLLIGNGASGNLVQGNFIGLDVSGTHGVGNLANGIEIAGNSNTIGGTTAGLGNFLSGNKNDGILLDSTASANLIQGAGVGTDYTGLASVGNSGNGIEVMGNGNTLGGATSAARNIITGNSGDGVRIDSGVSGTLVQGNYIGLNASDALGANAGNGINIAGTNNTIGGTVTAARNYISGNSGDGVLLSSSASGNAVLGNFLGVNLVSNAAANNNGIEVAGTQNTIGGSASGAFNVLSGNKNDGVLLDSSASGNVVLGNNVGLNVYGTVAVGNSIGIEVAGTHNTVGASYAVAPNAIAGNSKDGVLLDSTASGNQVLGNYIGTNVAGSSPLANQVGIEDAGSGNTIGGSVLGARNVISGNSGDGMLLDSTATAETVQGNFFGLKASGNAGLANGSNGLEIQGSNNSIGGATVYFARNFFCGNGNDGLLIDSSASGNRVLGSFIGLDVSGTHGVGNVANGVEVAGSGNTIGGITASDGSVVTQVISANGKDGVLIDSGATGNLVQGNQVGTDYTGTSAMANSVGIEVRGNNNTLGGTAANVFNVVSGNSTDGILIASGVSGTLVQGNHIGTDYTGASAVGNGAYGVNISGSNNTIGGSVLGASNIIADNTSGGVLISSGLGDAISQNSIFANGATHTGPGITLSNGGNNSLVAPTLTKAKLTGGNSLKVDFNFAAPTAKVSYVVEFFANPSGDPEGAIYLGSLTITPNNTNSHPYNFTTTTTVTGTNPLITATVTDPTGDTSPFSNGQSV
jgi:titin